MPAAILTLTKRTPPTALSTALAFFARHGSAKFRAGMSARYGIATRDKTFGVPMAKLHLLAKQLGRDHALAQALWATGIYEARMLAAFVEEPHRVTASQMDRWARASDNWAVTDTLCFKLFARRLAASPDRTAAFIGRDALKSLRKR